MAQAEELYEQSQQHIKNENFDTAFQYLQDSMKARKTAPAAHDIGVIYYMKGQNDNAIKAFLDAITIDPDYHQAYANLARITHEHGQYGNALVYAALAVNADPENAQYLHDFAKIAKYCKAAAFHPEIKQAAIRCFGRRDITPRGLLGLWLSLLEQDPASGPLLRLMAHPDYDAFKKDLQSTPADALSDEMFLLGLRHLIVPDMRFENFARHLRRALLEDPGFRAGHLELLSALAEYCFFTEYIFDTSEEELEKIKTLKAGCEIEDFSGRPCDLAVIGCYMPLYRLANAGQVATALAKDRHFGSLARCQITEPLREQALKKTIPALTDIGDGVSKEVQSQYEEHPYPRWKSPDKTLYIQEQLAALRGSDTPFADILIAGCGTGKQTVEYAQAFPERTILSIDLSRTSLSYAMRKAEELGIQNIEFGQADILKLGALERKFDLIVSSGVIHHMENPESGLAVLRGLLKPDGLLNLGLYSEIARRHIAAAQKTIRKNGFGNSEEDIKKFRSRLFKILKRKDAEAIAKATDYYSLSECRDMLFHVMEHRYTIPQIASLLEAHGLELLEFNLMPKTLQQYEKMFPRDPDKRNLRHWAKFEKKNPDAFILMYQFWVRPAGQPA